MTDPELIERITRSLAFMLRHQPETFDLELDPYGYSDLEEVVHALNERLGEPVEVEDVREAVRAGDRPRYEIQGDRIRALYGHSIPVDPGPSSKPPEFLYVAVPEQELERARRFGLRGGRRRFLHLALTQEDAAESGRRASRDYTVLVIHALDAWEEGISFYDRTALWLAEEVPTHLIEVAGTFHDGEDPLPRRFDGPREHGGRDRAPDHGGHGHGHGHEHGRGRRRGRGRGRDRHHENRRELEREPIAERGEVRGGEERPADAAYAGERETERPAFATREDGDGRERLGRGGRGGTRDERRGPRDSHGQSSHSGGNERGEGRREDRRPERRDARPPRGDERHEERGGERRREREPRRERSEPPAPAAPPGGFGAGLEAHEERPRSEPLERAPERTPPPRPSPPRTEPQSDRPAFGAGL